MKRRAVVLGGAVLLSCLAAGCSSTGGQRPVGRDSAGTIADRAARLAGIERFVARGKLGIISDSRSLSSRVRWHDEGRQVRLDLIAPLGLGRWQLVQEGTDRAWLRDERGRVLTGASIDVLLAQALGEAQPVPLAEIGRWMKGLPGSGERREYDASGRLQRLVYKDASNRRWRVWLRRYRTFDEVELPALITANGAVEIGDGRLEPLRMRWLLESFSTDVVNSDGEAAPPPRLTIPSS